MGINGSTQGVKLSSIPPSAAVSSSRIKPVPEDTSIAKVRPNRSKLTCRESAAVGLLDYDGDGYLDIYFVNGNHLLRDADPAITNRLYQNAGDGTFTAPVM